MLPGVGQTLKRLSSEPNPHYWGLCAAVCSVQPWTRPGLIDSKLQKMTDSKIPVASFRIQPSQWKYSIHKMKKALGHQLKKKYFYKGLFLNPPAWNRRPTRAERVTILLTHVPPLDTRLREEEGVGIQLLRLQPFPGHLHR